MACAGSWAVRGAHRGLSACPGAMSDSGSDVDGPEEDKRSLAGLSEDTGGSGFYIVVVLKALNATSSINIRVRGSIAVIVLALVYQ